MKNLYSLLCFTIFFSSLALCSEKKERLRLLMMRGFTGERGMRDYLSPEELREKSENFPFLPTRIHRASFQCSRDLVPHCEGWPKPCDYIKYMEKLLEQPQASVNQPVIISKEISSIHKPENPDHLRSKRIIFRFSFPLVPYFYDSYLKPDLIHPKVAEFLQKKGAYTKGRLDKKLFSEKKNWPAELKKTPFASELFKFKNRKLIEFALKNNLPICGDKTVFQHLKTSKDLLMQNPRFLPLVLNGDQHDQNKEESYNIKNILGDQKTEETFSNAFEHILKTYQMAKELFKSAEECINCLPDIQEIYLDDYKRRAMRSFKKCGSVLSRTIPLKEIAAHPNLTRIIRDAKKFGQRYVETMLVLYYLQKKLVKDSGQNLEPRKKLVQSPAKYILGFTSGEFIQTKYTFGLKNTINPEWKIPLSKAL